MNSHTRRFLKAGQQRYNSARILLENGMSLDAIYLAGYAPECALKALHLDRIPASKRDAAVASFRGGWAHEYDVLVRQLRLQGYSIPAVIVKHMRQIRWWSTDLRYEIGRREVREAEVFLAAALEILSWVQRNLT